MADQNPFEPPENEAVSAEQTPSGPSLRFLLFFQALGTTFCVIVGASEADPSFRLAQPLIPIVPLVALVQCFPPIMIHAKTGKSVVTTMALIASFVLALVGVWALLPLAQ